MPDPAHQPELPAPGRTAWRTLGTVACLVVLLLGGLLAWTWFAPRRVAEQRHEHREPLARVLVTSTGGDVTVLAGPAGVVTVERRTSWNSLRRPKITERVVGDTLTVAGSCPAVGVKFGLGSRCSVDLVVRVPEGLGVELRTQAGSVRADGVSGEVRLTSAAGDVTAHNVAGRLWMRADSGKVSGDGLRAREVDARIDAGDLDLAFAEVPDSVTALADAGDVTIALARGAYQVQARSSSGDQAVEVPNDPRATAKVTTYTEAGSIRIRYAG